MRLLAASIAGGLALFIWAGLSHAVLDWYAVPFHEFGDDQVVLETIEQEAPASGMYYLLHDYEHRDAATHVFLNVVKADRYRSCWSYCCPWRMPPSAGHWSA